MQSCQLEHGAEKQRRGDGALCVDAPWSVCHPQVRHGAATALRELLRSHAAFAGVVAPLQEGAETCWAEPGGSGRWQVAICGAPNFGGADGPVCVRTDVSRPALRLEQVPQLPC
jgi:hypothetical protein